MKIAYHFDSDHDALPRLYGFSIQEKIFRILLSNRNLEIHSKVFVGDLLLNMMSMDINTNGNRSTYTFNERKYLDLFYAWQNPENFVWKKFSDKNIEASYKRNLYVVCFESIDLKTAEYLHEQLEAFEPYLGALEVDEASIAHWVLYSESLIALGRLHSKKFNLFYQQDDETEDLMLNDYGELPFKEVTAECLNYRYTIFDNYTGYEEARRIAEWKRNSGALLAFIADDIVSRLSDIAPEIGNKLWSALKTFEEAETGEQFAQVTASCRRTFEYVTDRIFPPIDEKIDGHSLKAGNYKNRLYAYADESRKSDTNIDLIVASTSTLFDQWDKLNKLSNKGVHGEVHRAETRRCLLRTIMLLDDIVSLKDKPFEIRPNLKTDL